MRKDYNALAVKFKEACSRHGFVVTRNDSVLTIERRFTPGDKEAFTGCDMVAGSILGLSHARGGSQWGTDGGSVGGYSGLQKGHFYLNQSGVPVSFTKALKKLGV
jgi:hypothetical protein